MKKNVITTIIITLVTLIGIGSLIYSTGAAKQLYMKEVLGIEAPWIQALNYNIYLWCHRNCKEQRP